MVSPEVIPVFKESQIARFRSDGWLYVQGLFPEELVMEAWEAAKRVYSHGRSRVPSRWERSFPNRASVLNKLPLHPRLLQAAQELLQEDEHGIRLVHSSLTYRGASYVNPSEESRSYSSIWNNDAGGTGHSRSMLDSKQAWSAAKNVPGEWMQIDLGKVRSVAGTVVQGRGDWAKNQCVTKYSIQHSMEGAEWNDIEEEFPGPYGDVHAVNTFASPVRARLIRFVVIEWVDHISMRAGLLLSENDDTDVEGTRVESEWDSGQQYCLVPATQIPEGLMAILHLSSHEETLGSTTCIAECNKRTQHDPSSDHKTIKHTFGSVLFVRLDMKFRDDLPEVAGAHQIGHRVVLRRARAEWIQSDVFIRHLHGINIISELTTVQRSALGFPAPGHSHWTTQRISLAANRYNLNPKIYLAACSAKPCESNPAPESIPAAPVGVKEEHPDFTWTEAARLVKPDAANSTGERVLSPSQVHQWREEGWLLVDGIFPEKLVDEVAEAVAVSGFEVFPSSVFAVNIMALHPRLLQAVAELLQVPCCRIRMTQAMCTLKAGQAFETTRSPAGIPTWESSGLTGNQPMHQDFRNNGLLTPVRSADSWGDPDHVTAIAYFNDHSEAGGGTCFVPGLRHSNTGDHLYRVERRPAYSKGSILFYTLGTWHRGTPADPGCVRKNAFLTFRLSEAEWLGGATEVGAPTAAALHALSKTSETFDMRKFIADLNVDQRTVIGFPAAGDVYWNEETLKAAQELYGHAVDSKSYSAKL